MSRNPLDIMLNNHGPPFASFARLASFSLLISRSFFTSSRHLILHERVDKLGLDHR